MSCCADRESCGDTCDRFCPCISMYPTVCTVFVSLIVAAVFATVFGAYAFISLRTSIFRFDWDSEWFVLINISFLALVAALLIMALALALWCVCATYNKALICKTLYVLLLLLAILSLTACMVGSILVLYGASQKATFFARELELVWMNEVTNPNSTLACQVQRQLACYGFEDADCQRDSPTQNFSRCATRCRPEDAQDGTPTFDNTFLRGCRPQISSYYIQWNALLLAGSAVACILAIIAIFVTFGSVSFEKEK